MLFSNFSYFILNFKQIFLQEMSEIPGYVEKCLFLHLISFMKYQLNRPMKERKVWNSFEDKILRYLKQERGQKKWSVIARKMEEEFQIPGRTGKQCRERYHNHLDSAIVTTQWTEKEDQTLFDLHEQYGNKWSSISQNLPGRSDNCVKNRFYSKLRKSVRRLNKLIIDDLTRQYEPITPKLLSKIIETTELRYRSNYKIDDETIDFSIQLKNRLFHFEAFIKGDNIEGNEQIGLAKQLIADIFYFQQNFKKPGRVLRKRTSSFDEKDIFLHPKTCLKMNRSISNTSSYSENSDDVSFGNTSSNFSSFDQLEQQEEKPRKRSLTTRTSKDLFSRNSSDLIQPKKQTNNEQIRSTGDQPRVKCKQTQCDIGDANFIWMDQNEKLSMSLVEEYPVSQKEKQRKKSISSNSNKSNRSNSQKQFKSYDDFCSINDKFLYNMNIEDPAPQIVWRILEPTQRIDKSNKIMQDDDPILPSQFMDQQE